MFFFHWLRAISRVNAGTAEEDEFFHLEQVGRMDDICLNHQIVVYEYRWIHVVGPDASDLSSSQKT